MILKRLEINGLAIKESFKKDYIMDMEYGHLVTIVDFMDYFVMVKLLVEGNFTFNLF